MRQSNAVALAACLSASGCDQGGVTEGPSPGVTARTSTGEGAPQGSDSPSTALEDDPPLVPRPLAAPPALRPPRGNARAGASPPENPRFAECHRGFSPAATPEVDVLRLGMLCGPSNGFSLLTRVVGALGEEGKPARIQWEAARGDCFLIVSVAEAGIDDLEVEVLLPDHSRLLLESSSERWAVVSEDRPFCATRAGTFEGRFTTHGGRGAFAAAVWRGARMLSKARAPASAGTALPPPRVLPQ